MHISYEISLLQISRQYSSATFLSHHGVDTEIQPQATALGAAARIFLSFQMGPTKYTLNHSVNSVTRMRKTFTSKKKLLHASKGLHPVVLVYFEWTHFPFSYSHADFSDRTEPGLWIS